MVGQKDGAPGLPEILDFFGQGAGRQHGDRPIYLYFNSLASRTAPALTFRAGAGGQAAWAPQTAPHLLPELLSHLLGLLGQLVAPQLLPLLRGQHECAVSGSSARPSAVISLRAATSFSMASLALASLT